MRRSELKWLEARAFKLRSELATLEDRACRLRERIGADTAALDALTPLVLAAREAYRLAERGVAIAREPAK
jgi:hypothetical protein